MGKLSVGPAPGVQARRLSMSGHKEIDRIRLGKIPIAWGGAEGALTRCRDRPDCLGPPVQDDSPLRVTKLQSQAV